MYGPITGMTDAVSMDGTFRIVIPSSELNYTGSVEWGHNFSITLKSSSSDVEYEQIELYQHLDGGPVYAIDDGYQLLQTGGTTVFANTDLVIGPVEMALDKDKDLIFEITMAAPGNVPMSSDVVAGHSLWNVEYPSPPTITEHSDSGHRVLISNFEEV